MIKRFVIFLIAIIMTLSATFVGNTLRYTSRQQLADSVVLPAISDTGAALQRLSEAVQIPTISYDDREADVATLHAMRGFLEKNFPLCHAQLHKETVGSHSLLYRWEGSDTTQLPVMLIAHYDVVPAGDSMAWQQKPFGGVIKDGYIWGRGTLDDKVSVLGIMEAVEMLLKEGYHPKRTVYIGFGHDEERGGTGAQAIAATLKARGVKLAYLLDEGLVLTQGIAPAIERPLASIGLAEKGYVTVELTAEANGGHSSMPPPRTAIGMLSEVVAHLEQHPMPQKITPLTCEMFDYMGPEMSLPLRAVFANRRLLQPVINRQLAAGSATNATTRTTTAPTIFKAGDKENALAHTATALVNFRILPGETIDDVLKHVAAAVGNKPIAIKAKEGGSNPSPVASVSGEGFRNAATTARQVFGDVVVAPALCVATTDARHYTATTDNALRFLPVTLQNDDLAGIHGIDERLKTKDYPKVIQYYYLFIKNGTK